MANVDAPRGLRAIHGEYNAAPRLETLNVTAAIEIGEGQIVALAATGLIVSYTDAIALAGGVIGVAAHYVAAAATDRELQVYTDPNQVYSVQADDATITNVADCVGAFFDVVAPITINTTLQTSVTELDGSSATANVGTTTADLRPLQCLAVGKSIQNEIGAAISWTKFEVRLASPVHIRGMGSVGATAGALYRGI
jgi:hypothetical protein